MSDVNGTERAPLGIRLLHALGKEPAWSTMTAEDLAAFRDAENRKRASRLARVITGHPDRGAVIQWQEVALPSRWLRVRVYRPSPARGSSSADLPLVLHVHGGGFVGTAVQSDWVNSHLAARLPAVVVSVEHRLLAPGIPLSAAADDAIADARDGLPRRLLAEQVRVRAPDGVQLDGDERRGPRRAHSWSTSQSATILTPAFRSSATSASSTAANARTPRSPRYAVVRRSSAGRTSGFASARASAPVASTSTSRRSDAIARRCDES